jgi:hypothetical protein
MNQIGKALVMKEEVLLLTQPLPLSATGCCRDFSFVVYADKKAVIEGHAACC